MKLLRQLLVVLLALIGLAFIEFLPAAAATNRVLLVYDSQNSADHGYRKIDSLQRLLTSHQLSVRTIAESQYRSGMLRNGKYSGVITMVNWAQNPVNNRQFQHDRHQFSGIKLHIGGNLTKAEADQIGGAAETLRHQQLILSDAHGHSQLLPLSDTLTVFKPGKSTKIQQFGKLTTQEVQQRQFAAGIIHHKSGYLPFYSVNGLALQVASQLIGKLFQQQLDKQQPLLTITNVTPYSNLKLLNHLSRDFFDRGIPFAISTTSVGANTDLAAFKRFTKVLRNIETRNGIVFLKTPAVTAYQTDQRQLNQLMITELTSLGQNHVFPVGISTDGFWNQNQLYQRQGLKTADQVVLLPKSQRQHQVTSTRNSQVFKQSYYGLTGDNLLTIRQRQKMTFAMPTAVTFGMPTTQVGLRDLERKVDRLPFRWLNPATQLDAQVKFGSANYHYRKGTYFLNGSPVDVGKAGSRQPEETTPETVTGSLNHFFKFQSHVLLILFSAILVVLLVFIVIGRKIYVGMFKR